MIRSESKKFDPFRIESDRISYSFKSDRIESDSNGFESDPDRIRILENKKRFAQRFLLRQLKTVAKRLLLVK